jgi:hypothetical protein
MSLGASAQVSRTHWRSGVGQVSQGELEVGIVLLAHAPESMRLVGSQRAPHQVLCRQVTFGEVLFHVNAQPLRDAHTELHIGTEEVAQLTHDDLVTLGT